MFSFLDKGKWSRPSDKMAVYTEIEDGRRWGIRVTFIGDSALVEAIDGESCAQYKPGRELSSWVRPPSLYERLRGLDFERKLEREVKRKRAVARARNAGN